MKPTKWEIACPSCGARHVATAKVYCDSGKAFDGIICIECQVCGTSCASEPPFIQGSAPPFVPMSDRPFPYYAAIWGDDSIDNESENIWGVSLVPNVPDDVAGSYSRFGVQVPGLLQAYETRLAHLCGLIARRRERQIHNYLVREPIADFERKPELTGARIRLGLMMGGRNLNVRFAAGAVFGAGAETHILQQKFTALRGAALRGKA